MIELFQDKSDLSRGIRKNIFYFTCKDSSCLRGYNRTIRVFVMSLKGQPIYIGEANVNTASYCGDIGTAKKIINEIFNFKKDKNISIYEIY